MSNGLLDENTIPERAAPATFWSRACRGFVYVAACVASAFAETTALTGDLARRCDADFRLENSHPLRRTVGQASAFAAFHSCWNFFRNAPITSGSSIRENMKPRFPRSLRDAPK
jgi:hypothetical protein